jgi:threonine dehydrogenase-like Zn-dependent dehydrogenase
VQALVVTPGNAGSTRVAARSTPAASAEEVLVRTLEVGVCGTDREIDAGHVGAAPEGAPELVLGHEVVGVVERSGHGFERGTHVAATVRRGCGRCRSCAAGEPAGCLTGGFRERGIFRLDGFASELFLERPEHLVPIPPGLGRLGVLAEPMSVVERGLRHARVIGDRQLWEPKLAFVLGVGAIGALASFLLRLEGYDTWALARGPASGEKARIVAEAGTRYVSTAETGMADLARDVGAPDVIVEATGNAGVMHDALAAVARNGVVCLLGVDADDRPLTVDSGVLARSFVTDNKAVFGSVNADPRDWRQGLADLERVAARWPEALTSCIGLRAAPDEFRDAFDFKGVKATVRFA